MSVDTGDVLEFIRELFNCTRGQATEIMIYATANKCTVTGAYWALYGRPRTQRMPALRTTSIQ